MANKKLKKRQQAAAAMQDNSKLLLQDKNAQEAGNKDENDFAEDMSENLDRFETWIIANGKYIGAACVLILIGTAVFLTVAHIREKSIASASANGWPASFHARFCSIHPPVVVEET